MQPLTIESLKQAAISIQKMNSPELPKGLGWFTKLMAKFGWHRKYEIIILDRSKLLYGWKQYITKINK